MADADGFAAMHEFMAMRGLAQPMIPGHCWATAASGAGSGRSDHGDPCDNDRTLIA